MKIMNLDVFYDLRALHSVSMLKKRLKNTASVVLKAQLVIFGTDKFEAFLNNSVLFIICYLRLLLLDQQFVIVNLYRLVNSINTYSKLFN